MAGLQMSATIKGGRVAERVELGLLDEQSGELKKSRLKCLVYDAENLALELTGSGLAYC